MPYITIPTRSTGETLTASYLNTLSNNTEFLNGVANRPNTGFNSFRTTTTTLNDADAAWYFRWKHDFLVWRLTMGAEPNHVRVFFNGVKVYDPTPSGTTYEDNYEFTTWGNLPNLLGAWATSTSYDDNTSGDGDVVTNDGSYYKCIQDHTSDASNEPGVGGSWESFWNLLTLPTVNTIVVAHAEIEFGSDRQVTVQYMLNMESGSL